MAKLLTLLFLVVLAAPAMAEPTVVLVKVQSAQPLPDDPFDCPTAGTCSGGVRLGLSKGRGFSGPALGGRTSAVLSLHFDRGAPRPGEEFLLVLEPIADLAERQTLGADYFVVDGSRGGSQFCLLNDPAKWGLSVPEEAPAEGSRGGHCFSRAALLKSGT